MEKKRLLFGFTLIELLIVIALLGFLTVTGLSMFQGSQKRSRDTRRKNDLAQIAKALEMYANDFGYPASKVGSSETGKIVGCKSTPEACLWGDSWYRIVPAGTTTTTVLYMQKLPKDPGGSSYCYEYKSKGYKMYAVLEGDDPDKLATPVICNSQQVYNYVLRSSNLLPTQ